MLPSVLNSLAIGFVHRKATTTDLTYPAYYHEAFGISLANQFFQSWQFPIGNDTEDQFCIILSEIRPAHG